MINEIRALPVGKGLEWYREELFGVMSAYGDCWKDGGEGYSLRRLDFRTDCFVPVDVAMQILVLAGVKSYNEFHYLCLQLLDTSCTVSIAREGSVCLYVRRPNDTVEMPSASALGADEKDLVDFEPNVFRYWWD